MHMHMENIMVTRIDLNALGVNRTPTFFANGRPLPRFGEDALRSLVAEEIARSKR